MSSRQRRARPGRTYLAGAPQLVAHRGGSGLAPENTLEAFRDAVDRWGADMLELDVRLTRDGRVVVIHDETVDRTTDGTGTVRSMTLDELQSLDAGYRFVDTEGRHSFRGRGVCVPTLEAVLEACPGVWVNAEAKERAVAGPLVDLIARRGEEHRVLVAAEVEGSRTPARGYPGPWGASRTQVALFWLLHRFPALGYLPPVDILQLPERYLGVRIVTPGLIRAAHACNIPVHVWTVDDPDDMRRLLSWDVDGIQSDRPDILADVLVREVGRPAPPGLVQGE